jgi:DNA-binding response OmpR family regulator
MRILLIEDEAALALTLKDGLEAAHYDVDWVANGRKGLECATEGGYDLILLDVMLPDMDGWNICAALRRRRDTTPILMLTARDSVDDRVKGLETGADDYLPKPFDFKELRARIQALLRRDRVHKGRVIRIGDLEIDTESRKVIRGENEIPLTPREYTLLEAMALNEGQALSRERILERVWHDEDTASNTVEVYIWMLRKKIDADRSNAKLIRTVHGVGYMIKGPEAA